MAKYLKMTFLMDDDKKKTIQLVSPKDSLSRSQVEPVMEKIIDKEAIVTGNGAVTPVAVASAVIVETTDTRVI